MFYYMRCLARVTTQRLSHEKGLIDMCCKEGQLVAYIDGELDAQKKAEIAAHLQQCSKCHALYISILTEKNACESILGSLHAGEKPLPAEDACKHRVYAKLKSRIDGDSKYYGERNNMKKWKKISVGVAAAAAVLIAVTMTPMGKAAADLLGVFRMEKFVAVEFTQNDMSKISDALESGAKDIDLKDLGKITNNGEVKQIAMSPEDLQHKISGFPSLEDVDNAKAVSASYQNGMSMDMQFNVEKVNSLITRFGGTDLLPKEMDGKLIRVSMPANGTMKYTLGDKELYVAQTAMPEITVSEGVDPEAIRKVLVGLPFLPSEMKNQLESADDWTKTAIIPVPAGISEKITVNGHDGLLVNADKNDAAKAIIWQDGANINIISGEFSKDALVSFAKAVR